MGTLVNYLILKLLVMLFYKVEGIVMTRAEDLILTVAIGFSVILDYFLSRKKG